MKNLHFISLILTLCGISLLIAAVSIHYMFGYLGVGCFVFAFLTLLDANNGDNPTGNRVNIK